MKKTLTISITFLLLICSETLFSKGAPDKTFAGTGKIVRSLSSGFDYANATAVQSDGRILVSGYANMHGTTDFILMRYNSNGTKDLTFGDSGFVMTDFGKTDQAFGMIVQPDGRILLAGQTNSDKNFDYAIARYKTNGQLDSSFGVNGKVIAPIGILDDFGQAIDLQADGKIIVAGYSGGSPNYDFSIARFHPNGMIDSSFGIAGKVVTPVGNSADQAASVKVQANGKIVVAGMIIRNAAWDIAMIRYNTDGKIDYNFGSGGLVVTAPGSTDDIAFGLAIQPDQKILLSGSSNTGSYADMAVLRYDTAGVLDKGFNGSGMNIFEAGSQNEAARSIVLQPDGKILLGGFGMVGNQLYFTLARLKSNGSLDSIFGTDGVAAFSVGGDGFILAMALQTDKKIIAAGVIYNGNDYDIGITRFDPEMASSIHGIAGKDARVVLYPNPVVSAGSIHMAYKLESAGPVTIRLRDLQGKEIAILMDEESVKAGTQDTVLNLPAAISAGVYTIEILTGTFHTALSIMISIGIAQ